MRITYDGKYPSLCSGRLVVTTENGTVFDFGTHVLLSGGSVWFDEDWGEHVEDGEWSISEWPKDFPEDRKAELIALVNAEIPQGCCGGCV